MSTNITFHLLDIQTRDAYITSETKTSKVVTYESDDGDDDPEVQRLRRSYSRNKVKTKARREYTVHLFGSTVTGQSVRVDVTGFRPYFYIKMPTECSSTLQAIGEIKNYLEGHLSQKHNVSGEFTYSVVERADFIGFTGRSKYKFIRIEVPSIAAFRDARGLFLDQNNNPSTKRPLGGPWKALATPPAVYEANIDPMLRFIHDRGIRPCGWIELKNTEGAIDTTSNAVNAEIIQIDADVCDIVSTTAPPGIASAPFLKAFWDIECYSETGDFPVAKRDWTKVAKDIVRACEDGRITTADQIHPEILLALEGKSSIIGKILYQSVSETALEECALKIQQHAQIFAAARRNTAESFLVKDVTHILTTLYSESKGTKPPIRLCGDPVIQIGTILTRGTNADTAERHLFTTGTCDDIPDVIVHSYKGKGKTAAEAAINAELEMIDGWFTWLNQVNPDELVGYNVFGFDERYLWERAEELNLTADGNAIHELNRLYDLGSNVKLSENRLSSSALGDNFLYSWTTAGRLQVDLYFYVKRSGASLPSYKLDEVAKFYMSGKLKRPAELVVISSAPAEVQLQCTGAVRDVRPGRYIQLMDDTGESVCDKIRVLRVDLKDSKSGTVICAAVDLTEDEKEMLTDATKWAIVKDDVSPQDIFRLYRGSSADRARVGGYCIQDCELVLELYKKLEVFNNSMSMANVCLVPISFIFTRGQGVKIESLIFSECAKAETLIPVMENPPQTVEGVAEESYEGAIVLDPIPGLYKDSPVGVCDFASLYPSTIISENISHDMLVWVRDYKDNGDLIENIWGSDEWANCDGYAYTDIEFDLLKPDPADRRKNPEKIRCGRRICRYAEPLDSSKGLLPEIIKKLLAARKAKRKEAEREENPERKNLLDAEQLAYKVTANSLYGQLGSKTFKIRLVYLAASVTAYARKQLLFSKECIEKFYGPDANLTTCSAIIKYGDTDSVFVEVNPRNPETGERLLGRDARQASIDLTEEMGHFITQALRPPHDFEFDKIFDPLLMFSKKRYAGKMYEQNADDFVYKYMGIALKRRDNAPIVKTIFGGAMKELLDRNDVPSAANHVTKLVDELVEGKTSLGQLTITKSLRAEYANAQGVAHKVLANRMAVRDPGNAPAAGDRIPYVYIQPQPGQTAAKLQGDRIETPGWVREHGLKPDYAFYITNQIQNPVCEMFAIVIEGLPGYTTEHDKLLRGIENMEMRLVRAGEIAAEILLSQALTKCSKTAKREFADKFFGSASVVSQSDAISSRTRLRTSMNSAIGANANSRSVQQQQPSIQSFFGINTNPNTMAVANTTSISTMDTYIMDSLLMKRYSEEKAAKTKVAKSKAANASTTTTSIIKKKILK